jgi:two-component system aerobic respiration control sensor histidine kinase ArcB
MSFKATLTRERQRRKVAEAEVVRLQGLLESRAFPVATQTLPATQNFAQVVGQLKQVEQQLEYEQDLVRQVIDASPNLVYVEDEDGQCILANRRYVQLLSQLIPRGKQPSRAPALTLVAQLPLDTPFTFQESYQLKDGEILVYHTTKRPLTRSDGRRYLLTFSSDITDLKQAHQLAEELVQSKQLFMANMSHEIRTPLHGITGLTELLKKEPLSAEQADYVEMIQYNTENLLMVVDDILDFTKIESGQIKLESIPFDLLKAVQQAIRSFTFKTAEKGLLLRIVGLEHDVPLVKGDPYRLHQILVNLLSNAIKFTPRGAITITVNASEPTGSALPITISVADTGIGISAAGLDQLFNSFQQADNSIPRLYGGTGLGLTICKNLVELQGGQIEVQSELGRGSCFSFTIPYVVSDEPLIEGVTTTQQFDSLQGLSVLLVEDNAVNQLLAISMLGQWQVAVEMAQNGEEALVKAFQQKYDLILMDIQMPQLDGFAATSRLRQEANLNQHTPIIAMTADAVRVNADTCQELGFTACLTKPYHEVALYELLAEISQRAPTNSTVIFPTVPVDTGLQYDFSLLGKLGTDTTFIRKMLELFIDRVPGQVQLLQEAITGENWLVASRETHTLKTTFGSLNIQPATNYLKTLEKMIDLQALTPEVHSLTSAIYQAAQSFSALFKQDLAHLPEPFSSLVVSY